MALTNPGGIQAVLLAAGASRRFGSENKLLQEIEGAPLVRRVAERLASSRVAGIIVVTGFETERMHGALSGLDLQFVENANFGEGLASSIRCGVAMLPEKATGAMIVLADMPGITRELLNKLIDKFEEGNCEQIVYPERKSGVQGNPVIWPARHFAELQKLTGDTGAKPLIRQYQAAARPVPVEAGDVLDDIDAPEDFEA